MKITWENNSVSPWIARRLALSLIVVSGLAIPVAAQSFSKSFRVSPEASDLEVVNKMGSVTVVAAEGNAITITVHQVTGEARIEAVQKSPSRVKVEVSGSAPVDFVVGVPPHSTLDLLCYKGSITVKYVTGQLRARTTEGDIQLIGIRSVRVEARSTSGDVSFSGDVLPSGSYTLKSFSGRVEATLPATADFKLQASSFRGGLELGGFQMSFNKQTDKSVDAVSGSGRAAVYLWTQEGSIHLHRRP